MPEELIDVEDAKEQEAAYNEVLPAAMALAPHEIVVCMADPAIAYHNASAGTSAVLERQAQLGSRMTEEELRDISTVPKIAYAVIFAVRLFTSLVRRSTGEIATLLSEAYQLRRVMLLAARTAAEAGLIPALELESILRGTGRLDASQDLVDLATLLRRHATALEGKTPVTAEMLTRAAELGSLLVSLMKPAGTPVAKGRPEDIEDAAERRDRIWTLLQRRYELVWKAGAFLFGRDVDEHVPPLQSHTFARKREA